MRLKAKKRLGQNFLVDRNVRAKILGACDFQDTDIVLEVGAGTGEMTGLIAAKAKKVLALELDHDCFTAAREILSAFGNIELINQDVLNFDLRKHFGKNKVKVFGNIPYYISSPIIERLIKFRDNITEVFITAQKEFARRLAAKSGSKAYGCLSCFVQYYTEPRIVMNIRRGSFFPVPKVDSSLVKLVIRGTPPVKVSDERIFFKVIRAAFNKRRKTLKNSLAGVVSRQELNSFFRRYSLDPRIRPERLSLEDFARLSGCLYE